MHESAINELRNKINDENDLMRMRTKKNEDWVKTVDTKLMLYIEENLTVTVTTPSEH